MNVLKQVQQLIKSNSTEILTGVGVTGVLSTAYLASKGTVKAVRLIDSDEPIGVNSDDRKERWTSRVKATWTFYLPAVGSGALTVAAIIGSHHLSSRKAAAVIGAYSVLDRSFSEYKEKVVEQIGENKERALRDELAQERVDKHPPKEVIVTGTGEVLCMDGYSGRYFHSNMQALGHAVNEINYMMNAGVYATLTEFYQEIGLDGTAMSDNMGWDNDQLMELKYSTTMSPNDVPCIVIDFNYIKPI